MEEVGLCALLAAMNESGITLEYDLLVDTFLLLLPIQSLLTIVMMFQQWKISYFGGNEL